MSWSRYMSPKIVHVKWWISLDQKVISNHDLGEELLCSTWFHNRHAVHGGKIVTGTGIVKWIWIKHWFEKTWCKLVWTTIDPLYILWNQQEDSIVQKICQYAELYRSTFCNKVVESWKTWLSTIFHLGLILALLLCFCPLYLLPLWIQLANHDKSWDWRYTKKKLLWVIYT